MTDFCITMPESTSDQYTYDLSVLIVSFNTLGLLRECLRSVYRETGAYRTEVIVVDNASTDGSMKMVDQEFPDVIRLQSKVNLGFGRANNLGFESARGRYLVLLNSDAFLTE